MRGPGKVNPEKFLQMRCGACEITKLVNQFLPSKTHKYGRHPTCKACRAVRSKQWRQSITPELRRTYEGRHRAKFPHKVVHRNMLRCAAKARAKPAWANDFLIEEAYDLAARRTKATGYQWHVDHIVPLRSSRVCGLHVENNLRVIPAQINLRKGNRVWPDMPGGVVG